MDFSIGLPSFTGSTAILVVVDHFSKAAHFGVILTRFSAFKVAELLITTICKLHGITRSIISDRDQFP